MSTKRYIDTFFIKYAWNMTRCQKHTRRGRTTMKFGMETIFGMTNSILAFIFEIDTFFIKYSWSDDKVSKHRRRRRTYICGAHWSSCGRKSPEDLPDISLPVAQYELLKAKYERAKKIYTAAKRPTDKQVQSYKNANKN